LATRVYRQGLERNVFPIPDSNPGPSSALPSRGTDYVTSALQEMTL